MTVRGPVEHAVLDISGELDFSSVDDMVDLVAHMPHHIVSIDLAGLEFVDGAGARAIEQVRDEREQRHHERPAIIGATPAVDRTLRFVRNRTARLTVA
jgi:anti-anti-sigma regulatory factor